MRSKNKFLYSLIILLNTLYSNVSNGNAVLINHLTDLNGLPQNSIKGLLIDDLGYLWIATEHGLARYDGNNIKTYFDSALVSSRFYGIFQGRNKNEFYAVSEYGALFLIKNGRLKKTQLERTGDLSKLMDNGNEFLTLSGIGIPNVFLMDGKTYSIDAKFNIKLISASEKRIAPVEIEKPNVPVFPKSSITTPTNIFIFQNKIYGISKKGDRFVITELLKNFEDISNIYYCLYSEQTQTLFLGTNTNGLYIYKINSGIKIPKLAKNKSYSAQIVLDSNRIFSGGDIIALDALHSVKQVRNSIIPYALLKDHFGHIYYPSKSGGIYMVSELWDHTKPFKAFNETGLWMYEDQYYRMWIYDKYGISIYNNSRPKDKKLIQSFSRFRNVKGYIVYNPERKSFFIIDGDHIYRIDEKLQLMDSIRIDGKLNIRSLFISNTGILWLATYGQGVKCVKNNVTYDLPMDFEKYMLLAHEVFQDRNYNYWITTNRGLFKIRAGMVEANLFSNNSRNIYYNYYSTYDGLPTNEFNGGAYPGIVKMSSGFYSLPTISGLVWINPDHIPDPTLNSDILIEEVIADNEHLDPEKPLVFDRHISRLTINLSIVYWGDQKNIHIRYRLPGLDKDWNILNAPYSITYSNLPGGSHILEIQVVNQLQINHLVKKDIFIDVPLRFYQEWWFYVLCVIAFIGIVVLYSNYKHKRIKRLNMQLENQIRERTNELILKNQKIGDSLQLLEKKQEVLDLSISIKDKVMSIFSHNIVGPLKFITVLTDRMTKDATVVDEKNIKAIDTTSKSLLLHSVDLATWVKTQDEQYRIQKELISLNDFVPLKMQLFRPMAEARDIKLEVRMQENIELYSDKQLLNIVFYNIVDNAIKHTSNGSITIEAVKSRHDVKIIFTDTGSGMAESQVNRINDYASNPSMKRFNNENGTGIGWFIINDCLSLLKASYTVESSSNTGTRIVLSFPL